MKKKLTNKKSLTDFKRLKEMGNSDIDTSDIPPLNKAFFKNANLRLPESKSLITIRVDTDVLKWLKSQGKGYQTKINAILKSYMEYVKERRL
jgi:uncharacterized protein (DUF4415 family)